jgi:hypothetical protein
MKEERIKNSKKNGSKGKNPGQAKKKKIIPLGHGCLSLVIFCVVR